MHKFSCIKLCEQNFMHKFSCTKFHKSNRRGVRYIKPRYNLSNVGWVGRVSQDPARGTIARVPLLAEDG